MKRGYLYNINNSIEKNSSSVSGNLEFNYFLAKLDRVVKEFITDFEKVRPQPSENYNKYLQERNKLIDKYAVKDDNNEYKIENDSVLLTNKPKFEIEHSKLIDQYKEDIESYTLKLSEFVKFMEEEIDLNTLPKIKKDLLPTSISFDQIRYLIDLIEE